LQRKIVVKILNVLCSIISNVSIFDIQSIRLNQFKIYYKFFTYLNNFHLSEITKNSIKILDSPRYTHQNKNLSEKENY